MTSINSFAALGVPTALTRVLAERDIRTPTPIQRATLADAIAGRDILGRGRTGSGKTYAFLLPLVTRLVSARTTRRPHRPRGIVLAPTRELAIQIEAALQPLAATCGLRSQTVFGGVGQQPQVRALRAGVDVLVACPGRLEDLVRQGHCRLDAVQVTVVDEADHMADLGFLPIVSRLMSQTPPDGQRLFFSATLDNGIDGLARRFLHRPAVHHADAAEPPAEAMAHHVLHVRPALRLDVLVDLAAAPGRTLIFTRTKHRAKGLARQLKARGVAASELHGDLGQSARTRNINAFHSGGVTSLVATDIAARGIHVDDVELVVHADPPVEHKAYIHRSGRTARGEKQGTVVTLMTDDQVTDVRTLVRAAGVRPTTTVVDAVTHPVLRQLATGERRYDAAASSPLSTDQPQRRNGGRQNELGSLERADQVAGERTVRRRPRRAPRVRNAPEGRSSDTQGVDTPHRSAGRPPARGIGNRGDHSAASFSRRSRGR